MPGCQTKLHGGSEVYRETIPNTDGIIILAITQNSQHRLHESKLRHNFLYCQVSGSLESLFGQDESQQIICDSCGPHVQVTSAACV